MVAGGGTAGHVNSALALGWALEQASVTFLGTERGAEARLVPAAGFELRTFEVRGFDRARPWTLAGVGGRALAAVAHARRLIAQLAPRVVVGMGGYVSLPACIAARSLRVPVVIHEQNIVLGLANRVSAPLARRIAVSFEETLAHTWGRGVLVGNPVLPEMASADPEVERARGLERFRLDPARRTLLVFGGSLGARRINDATVGLRDLWRERRDLQIVHIFGRSGATGGEDADPVDGLVYRAVPYVDRMVEAYSVADLAVCRGGATTIAELTVRGVPSVIVPYPYHRDRQQERQARVLERHGAARVLLDEDATSAALSAAVLRLLEAPQSLAEMRRAARALGRPDAARRLAEVVTQVAA